MLVVSEHTIQSMATGGVSTGTALRVGEGTALRVSERTYSKLAPGSSEVNRRLPASLLYSH